MKKICFLIGNINHSGGTERVTTLIANELSKSNKVYILSISGGQQPFFSQDKNIVNERLFEQTVSMKKHFFSAVAKIRKYLIENKIDTLIVVDSISCVFTVPACFGLKINHICWEHFNLKVDLGSKFRGLGRWLAAKWCSKVVTLTERDKTFWDERFNLGNTNKVIAIANPSPYEIQKNIPNLEKKTILCVGRLTYQKGFDLLILTWSKIVNQLPDWKIIIVGTGEDEQVLKNLVRKYKLGDTIEFVGQQKDVSQYYCKASFYCMSSRFEGLPMVLLEAQSYGLPIVSFDCDTGPAEIVINDENGGLVTCLDTEQLAKKILQITKLDNDVFLKYVLNSKKIIQNFDINNISKKWLEVI